MARRPGTKGIAVFLLGNVLFSILGLVIGYFLLVQFRPDMNFLGLNVPIVDEMEIPKVPEGWPEYDWDPTKPYVASETSLVDPAGNDAVPVAEESAA